MILSDTRILEAMGRGQIVIRPFRRECLGPNSYDVHLGPWLATYADGALDAKRLNPVEEFRVPPRGFVLVPGQLYLGVTQEYTETHAFVPFLEGKSSVGRLGIDIHSTAGKGDVGFCNYWTLEMSVKLPVRIYAGMPIGQLIYFEVSGEVADPYDRRKSAKYRTVTAHPIASRMHLNFRPSRRATARRQREAGSAEARAPEILARAAAPGETR
jgi:dCTP deaminase